MQNDFSQRLSKLNERYSELITRPNEPRTPGNGIFLRYKHPVLTAAHAPLFWRYDLYDIRLTRHQDGWIYGLFCTEHRDPEAPLSDQSAAVAQCGIARTKDLLTWERLADLQTSSPQQRNVVPHPEFVQGKYAFYTRPQDGFINAGTDDGQVFIYYASSDTRMHVATTTIEQLLDYIVNTPADEGDSFASVTTFQQIIDKNKHYVNQKLHERHHLPGRNRS